MSIRRAVVILLAAAGLAASVVGISHGATVYIYENSAGKKWMSNRKNDVPAGYRLLRKYQADDYFGTAERPAPPSRNSRALQPRPSDFDKLITRTANRLGLEAALLKAIIHIESAFNPAAVSPKGAGGLMQLMPTTAERYGVTDRFNPHQSLRGGGTYMRDLLQLFDDDIKLALAAYNAGENAVVKYNGIPPYKETRNYVKRVMEMREQYRKNLAGA